MFVHQTWKESRLKLPDDIFEEGDDYVTLPPEFFDNLWQPDPYFLNSKIAGEPSLRFFIIFERISIWDQLTKSIYSVTIYCARPKKPQTLIVYTVHKWTHIFMVSQSARVNRNRPNRKCRYRLTFQIIIECHKMHLMLQTTKTFAKHANRQCHHHVDDWFYSSPVHAHTKSNREREWVRPIEGHRYNRMSLNQSIIPNIQWICVLLFTCERRHRCCSLKSIRQFIECVAIHFSLKYTTTIISAAAATLSFRHDIRIV